MFSLSRLRCAALAVAVVTGVCARVAAGVELPPIRYRGEFLTSGRVTVPEQGEQTIQIGSSTRVDADTFVWKPWFATLGASLNLSRVNTFTETDATATSISGNGNIHVFPRSRFPFSTFLSVSDSSNEFGSGVVQERDVRRTRFGAAQRYTPLAGNAQYSGRLERAIEEGSADGIDETTDRADLAMTYRLSKQVINATLNIERTAQEADDARFLDIVATGSHSFQPKDTVSLESFATLTKLRNDSALFDNRLSTVQLSSFGVWRPVDKPLTVTANARFNATGSEVDGVAGATTYSTALSTAANYTISPSLRLSGSLSANFTGGASAATTSESASLSYTPDSISLKAFSYNYFGSVSASNQTGASDGGSRNLGGVLGHGITRSVPLGRSGTLGLSLGASQSASTTFDTRSGGSQTLNHSASLGLAHTLSRARTSARLALQDTRSFTGGGEFAGRDSAFQGATLQVNHDSTLGAFAGLGANLSMGVNRQVVGDDANTSPFSSLGVSYRNGRLFGVRRLRFTSQLSLSADSLSFIRAGDDDGRREVSWDNQFNYSIGRVDMRFTTLVTDNDGRLDTAAFFTLSRRFGGVYRPGE